VLRSVLLSFGALRGDIRGAAANSPKKRVFICTNKGADPFTRRCCSHLLRHKKTAMRETGTRAMRSTELTRHYPARPQNVPGIVFSRNVREVTERPTAMKAIPVKSDPSSTWESTIYIIVDKYRGVGSNLLGDFKFEAEFSIAAFSASPSLSPPP
jgi:hypothetical protein